MARCGKCGTENLDYATYCTGCGSFLLPPQTAPASPMPSQPPAGYVAYSCAVCAFALGPQDYVCARCRAPRGMAVDPNSPTPGAFAPITAIQPPRPWESPAQPARVREPLPAELERAWNWGAFWLSFLWGLNHRAYQTLVVFFLAIIGYSLWLALLIRNDGGTAAWMVLLLSWIVGLPFSVWYGIRGNAWAWKNREFESVEHFKKVQSVWAGCAKVLLGLTVAALVAGAIGAIMAAGLDLSHG